MIILFNKECAVVLNLVR